MLKDWRSKTVIPGLMDHSIIVWGPVIARLLYTVGLIDPPVDEARDRHAGLEVVQLVWRSSAKNCPEGLVSLPVVDPPRM
jgi:hypothetical protein